MNREASVPVVVIGGIDTHKDIHVAAVVDDQGSYPTRPRCHSTPP